MFVTWDNLVILNPQRLIHKRCMQFKTSGNKKLHFYNIGIEAESFCWAGKDKTSKETLQEFDFKSLRSRPWKSALSNGWAVYKDLVSKLVEVHQRFNQENYTIFGRLWQWCRDLCRRNRMIEEWAMPMLPIKERTHIADIRHTLI